MLQKFRLVAVADVFSNDTCTFEPVTHVCEVQLGDRFFAQLVKRKEWDADRGEWKFTISNKEGRENGWAYMRHIYGKLVEVMP